EDEPVIEPEEEPEPELDIIEDEPVIEPESEEEPEPELGIDEDEPVIEPEPEEEPEPELDIEEDEPVIELGSEVEPEPELTDEERSELFKGFEDVSETVEIADTEPEPALESEGTTVMLDDPIADVDSTASESEGSAETEPIMIDIPVPAEKKSSKKKKKADRVSDGTLLIDMDDENVSALMGVRKKKKKKLVTGSRGIVGIPTKVLVIMAAVLMLMVIGGSVWLFLRLSGWAEDRQRAINADRIMLDNTETKSNSLNIIYCDALLPLGDDSLHITKTSFDGQSSMFYLAERPDFTRYGFEIVDNFGSRHSLDPAFIYEDGTVDFSDKTLRFEPLTAGAASFTMYVTDMDSGAVYEHEFGFETPHGLIFEKRYDHVSTIRDAEDRVVGIINGMRFASTGTALYFTLEEQEMNPHYMPEAGGSSVSLTDSGVSIGPLRQEDVNYGAVGGGTMYRMDFRPINYLTGSVRFTFSRLMLNLPLGVTADARPLLRNLNPELYAVYEAGEYAVVLERVLTYTDGSYQLVFHAEDTTAVVEGPGDRSNRREVLLDCEAVITLHSGEQVSLPGVDGQSKAEGSNVFFKVQDSPYAQEIAAGQIRSFEINIKSVLVRVPDIAYEVDLDSAFVTGQAFPDTLRAQLIATNTEKEDYSVSVVAYEEMGDNHRAVVRELWKDESGEYRVTTREVAGFIDPYGLILNTDNIISEIVGLK
ncbi:MAG: procyclic acidic repetitive family protein, partial [Clostridiales bacterium]|nr:procyclic acidic repetitive family protein [Clostridiales bacterium]